MPRFADHFSTGFIEQKDVNTQMCGEGLKIPPNLSTFYGHRVFPKSQLAQPAAWPCMAIPGLGEYYPSFGGGYFIKQAMAMHVVFLG